MKEQKKEKKMTLQEKIKSHQEIIDQLKTRIQQDNTAIILRQGYIQALEDLIKEEDEGKDLPKVQKEK